MPEPERLASFSRDCRVKKFVLVVVILTVSDVCEYVVGSDNEVKLGDSLSMV